MRFTAAPIEEPAEVESIDSLELHGRPALRVRFARPVSPLAARGFRLEREGRSVKAEALITTGGREVWLVPGAASEMGNLTVMLDSVPGRNGRALAHRRLAVPQLEQQ